MRAMVDESNCVVLVEDRIHGPEVIGAVTNVDALIAGLLDARERQNRRDTAVVEEAVARLNGEGRHARTCMSVLPDFDGRDCNCTPSMVAAEAEVGSDG